MFSPPRLNCILVLGVLLAATVLPAHADVILSPTAVLQNTAGDFSSDFDILQAIDQSGLSANFTSGVTDFDTYLAGNPTHTLDAIGNEYFSPEGVNAGIIDFDLGAEYSINRLALWNEEVAGISTLNILTSNDPLFLTSNVAGDFLPSNNPNGADYSAEVFSLTPTNGRYVRFSVTGPQPEAEFNGIGAGEFAFGVSAIAPPEPSPVPEPGTIALMGVGLASLAAARRRKKEKMA